MQRISDKMWEVMGGSVPTKQEIFGTEPNWIKPNRLKIAIGRIRLFMWGVCPECNHDAPELYDCEICGYYKYLPRYRSQQTKDQRRDVWNRFLRGTTK